MHKRFVNNAPGIISTELASYTAKNLPAGPISLVLLYFWSSRSMQLVLVLCYLNRSLLVFPIGHRWLQIYRKGQLSFAAVPPTKSEFYPESRTKHEHTHDNLDFPHTGIPCNHKVPEILESCQLPNSSHCNIHLPDSSKRPCLSVRWWTWYRTGDSQSKMPFREAVARKSSYRCRSSRSLWVGPMIDAIASCMLTTSSTTVSSFCRPVICELTYSSWKAIVPLVLLKPPTPVEVFCKISMPTSCAVLSISIFFLSTSPKAF